MKAFGVKGLKRIRTFNYKKKYKPKKESINFFSWRNTMLSNEQYPSPKTHYMLIDYVLSKKKKVEAICHREFAKSTLLTKYIPLKVAQTGELENFGKVTNMAIFSATYTQATSLLESVKGAWENSEQLYATIKLAKKRNGRYIADKDNRICYENAFGNIVDISAYGAGDSIRGAKIKDEHGQEKRLQLLLFDDILKDNTLDSEKERKKIVKWFTNTVLPAVDTSHFKVIILGTPMHQDDLLMTLAKSKFYLTLFFPIADKMPMRDAEITSSWPTLHSPKRIKRAYEEAKSLGQEDGWIRERMLRVVSEENRVFKKTNTMKYNYEKKKKDFNNMYFFTSLDVAISQSEGSAESVVFTIGVDDSMNWFLVEAYIEKGTPTDVINELFRQVIKFNPIEIRAEEVTIQQVFNYFIEQEMEKRNVYFTVEKLVNNTIKSKHSRIMGIEPRHKRQHMFLPKKKNKKAIEKLEEQLYGYLRTGATTPTIDGLDCLANFNDPDFVIAPTLRLGTEIGVEEYDFDEPNVFAN